MTPILTRCLKETVTAAVVAGQISLLATPASAFCGFYVAKADAKLFNKASKVVIAREGKNTAVTMASDYDGDPKEFAIVIPVPTFIARRQIGIVDMKTIDHLDAYTAPRLVEYSDRDPCEPAVAYMSAASSRPVPAPSAVPKSRGVTVEANYDVGEYDVSILSAQESDGLVAFLARSGYRLPEGAAPVLGSYIGQNMHFFVAKVNLDRMALIGNRFLRPLQVRYETDKFMLPIRLGTVNAQGPQDMIVMALTRKGRVEPANYPGAKVPSDIDVPLYVKDEFGKFYTAMFDRAVARQDGRAVFLEYAWDMGWCDPCAAEPLGNEELVELGARWIDGDARGGSGAYVTRLHVRYDAAHFPEDLAFLETSDRGNFQGRYILQHPWRGTSHCQAANAYRAALPARYAKEAATLADLTGWKSEEIHARMAAAGEPFLIEPPRAGWFFDGIFRPRK